MNPIRLIAIGSPHGLDRIAWLVSDEMQARGVLDQFPGGSVEVSQCDRPGSRLVSTLEEADAAILIDAMQAGTEPGTVWRLTLEDLKAQPPLLSSHDFGVAQALALGKALGRLPKVVIYAAEIGPDLQDERQLLQVRDKALAGAVAGIVADLQNWLGDNPG